jgi:mycothiol system anti-sigma-R factor
MGRFGCQEVDKFVHVFVDGEFDDADRREFELHLADCPRCRALATFQARFRQTLKASVPRATAPAALRQRILVELAKVPPPELRASPAIRFWRSLVRLFRVHPIPVGAAAAVLLALMLSPGAGVRPVVAESVSTHRRALPLEVPGPDAQSVRSWFDGKVDFPVRPLRFGRKRASLVGARLSNIQSRQAAYFLYNVGGSKVSVMMFPAEGLPLDAPRRRRIRGHEVYLDNQGGYQVAIVRDRGVGYAITGDVDESEMLRLVETAFAP